MLGDGCRLRRNRPGARNRGFELTQPFAKGEVFLLKGSDALLQLLVHPSEIIDVLQRLGRRLRLAGCHGPGENRDRQSRVPHGSPNAA